MAGVPRDKNTHEPIMTVIDDAVVEAGKDAGEEGGKRCFVERSRDGCFLHLFFTLNLEAFFFF